MKKMNKKGQMAFYITFMFSALLIVVVAAVIAPLGVEFNTQLYLQGQEILNDTIPDINNITDSTVRASVLATVNQAQASAANNIEVNANIFQYGWVLLIITSVISTFLLLRRVVEFGGGGII